MSAKIQSEQDAFWADNLNATQEETLQKFRSHLQQANLLFEGHDDDVSLCRFLKARKWDVPKAAQMWQEMVAWRSQFFAQPVQPPFSDEERRAIRSLYPHFYHKTDNFGRPVYYELLGELKIPQLLNIVSVDRLVSFHCHSWERTKATVLPACSVAAGRHIYSCTTVLDLKGVKMTMFGKETREFISAIASIDQARYPEHLGQMFIVNAPMIFKAIWQVVCPWLEARTQAKIQVFSYEKQSHEALRKVIPPHNLIRRLGGACDVPQDSYGTGPWTDANITDQATRSKWRYKDSSSLTDSNVSADTDVNMG